MTDQEAVRRVAEAKAKYGDDHWWDGSDWEKAWGQLNEDILVMEFGAFHRALEAAAGRPVWTHELALSGVERLRQELLAKRIAPDQATSPTMQEIIDLIPPEKRVVVSLEGDEK